MPEHQDPTITEDSAAPLLWGATLPRVIRALRVLVEERGPMEPEAVRALLMARHGVSAGRAGVALAAAQYDGAVVVRESDGRVSAVARTVPGFEEEPEAARVWERWAGGSARASSPRLRRRRAAVA